MVSSTEGEAIACLNESKAARIAKIRANTTAFLKLRSTDAQALSGLLAQNCVKRGSRWLNRYAPSPGWWRNCLDAGRSRVSMSRDNGGILSLAFEYERDMTDNYGYVIDAIVLRELGFRYPSRKACRLGLSPGSYITGWAPFPKRYPGVVITSGVLDKAWATFLENPPSMWRSNYRHQSAVRGRLARLLFIDTRARPWRFWIWNLRQLFKWPPWRPHKFEEYYP